MQHARLTRAPDHTLAGLFVAGPPPKAGSQSERVDTQLGPEPGSTEVMKPAVAAILPYRGRAAERHGVPTARRQPRSSVRPGADRGIFGWRRPAAGHAGQRADERPVPLRARLAGPIGSGATARARRAGSLM